MSDPVTNSFQLREWQIHASENCIVRGDERILLEPRVMDLLVFFGQHPEQTLGKDEILLAVWGSLHHSDSVIARAISLLRQHLGDDARKPAYIRTIPSRGYRLIAPVRPLDETPWTAADDDAEVGYSERRNASTASAAATGTPLFRTKLFHATVTAAFVLLVLVGVTLWLRTDPSRPRTGASPLAASGLHTIAVSPLADQKVPGDHRYLLHNVHEAVASALLKHGKHRVLILPEAQDGNAAPSAATYLSLARQSGADAVLTGTAVESNSRITVTLRLIATDSGESLWSMHLDEKPGSEQAFRDGIVASVATSLGAALEPPAKKQTRDDLVDPKAYRLQAQARWYLQQRSVQGVRKAHELFKQAVERDPAYADAFSGLALSFIHQIQYAGMPPGAAYAQAMAAAERALELDPEHSEGVTAKAQVLALRDWNFTAAISLLRRALALDPGNIAARQHLAEMQVLTGQYDAAVESIDRALAIKPYSALLLAVKAMILTHAQRYRQALQTLKQVDLLAPNFSWHYVYWSYALERTGKPIEAARLRAQHHSFLAALDAPQRQVLRRAIDREGPAALWRAVANHAEVFRKIGLPVYHFYDLEQLAARGRDAQALALLDSMLQTRGEAFLMLQVSPALDRLRGQHGYAELMQRHGVPVGAFRPGR